MTNDEKAKAYDEALERAKELLLGNEHSSTIRSYFEHIFPELRESEDERIRMVLCDIVRDMPYMKTELRAHGLTVEKVITYLEKQKEQKEELVYRLNGLMQDYIKEGKDAEEKEHRFKCYRLFWDALEDTSYFEQKEQKPINSFDIVPYIDDKIAALQDMWREEKVAFDWDDVHEMIEDVARHFYQKEQKPAEWNDTDMKEARDNLISVCRDWERGQKTTLLPITAVRARYFLEHLTEPRPAEWSEEDGKKMIFLERLIEHNVPDGQYGWADGRKGGFVTKSEAISMLKSLRPVKQEWSKKDEDKLFQVMETLLADKTVALRETPHCKALHEAYDEMLAWLKSLRPSWKQEEPEYYQHFDPDC